MMTARPRARLRRIRGSFLVVALLAGVAPMQAQGPRIAADTFVVACAAGPAARACVGAALEAQVAERYGLPVPLRWTADRSAFVTVAEQDTIVVPARVSYARVGDALRGRAIVHVADDRPAPAEPPPQAHPAAPPHAAERGRVDEAVSDEAPVVLRMAVPARSVDSVTPRTGPAAAPAVPATVSPLVLAGTGPVLVRAGHRAPVAVRAVGPRLAGMRCTTSDALLRVVSVTIVADTVQCLLVAAPMVESRSERYATLRMLAAGRAPLEVPVTIRPTVVVAVEAGDAACQPLVQRVVAALEDRGASVVRTALATRRVVLRECARVDRLVAPSAVPVQTAGAMLVRAEFLVQGQSVWDAPATVGATTLVSTTPGVDPLADLTDAVVLRLLGYRAL